MASFKPSRWKLIVSILILLLWYLFLYIAAQSVQYAECLPVNVPCDEVFEFNIIPEPSGCGCPSNTKISTILSDLFIVLLPGLIVYTIWSFCQKRSL